MKLSFCNLQKLKFCSPVLSVNTEKTYCMTVTNRFVPNDLEPIVLDSDVLAIQTSLKFLGVSIDSGQSFIIHTKLIAKKLSKSVGILFRLSTFLSKKPLISLYYSLIYPRLL